MSDEKNDNAITTANLTPITEIKTSPVAQGPVVPKTVVQTPVVPKTVVQTPVVKAAEVETVWFKTIGTGSVLMGGIKFTQTPTPVTDKVLIKRCRKFYSRLEEVDSE
jgi:hypothetical protein